MDEKLYTSTRLYSTGLFDITYYSSIIHFEKNFTIYVRYKNIDI